MVGHEDEAINGDNKITSGTYGGPHAVEEMFQIMKKLDYGFFSAESTAGENE